MHRTLDLSPFRSLRAPSARLYALLPRLFAQTHCIAFCSCSHSATSLIIYTQCVPVVILFFFSLFVLALLRNVVAFLDKRNEYNIRVIWPWCLLQISADSFLLWMLSEEEKNTHEAEMIQTTMFIRRISACLNCSTQQIRFLRLILPEVFTFFSIFRITFIK